MRISPAFRGKNRSGEKRLSVVEVAAVDARHRLVLLRRDETEHLVLLGTNNDLLLETNITPPKPSPEHGGSFLNTLRSAGEAKK